MSTTSFHGVCNYNTSQTDVENHIALTAEEFKLPREVLASRGAMEQCFNGKVLVLFVSPTFSQRT